MCRCFRECGHRCTHDRGKIPLIPSWGITSSHGRGVDFDALIIHVLSNLECRVGLV